MADLQLLGRRVMLQPIPCVKCSSTLCRYLHDLSGTDCHLQGTCDACPRLLQIDKQIDEAQDTIIRLVKARLEIKRHVNYSHDRLIGRLPVEVVSMIFTFYGTNRQTGYYPLLTVHAVPGKIAILQPSLLLGSVCRHWREITLTTPQLWTRLAIDFSRDINRFNVIQDWLNRSGGLPLTIAFKTRDSTVPSNLEPLLSLVRSHAARWVQVEFIMPPNLIRDILSGLTEPTRVRILRIKSDNIGESPSQPIVIDQPFGPTWMRLENYFPPETFVRWDNLFSVDLDSTPLDALVNLIGHGSRLEIVKTSKIKQHGHVYPLPSSPVVNSSIKLLVADACRAEQNFLRYVCLPSLASLVYHFCIEEVEDIQGAHDVLVNFLRLSAPPLLAFRFDYRVQLDYNNVPGWRSQWSSLPQITELELDITSGEGEEDELDQEDEMTDFIDHFFRELAYDRETVVLPNLRGLLIKTNLFAQETWTLFASIFPPSQRLGSAEVNPIDISALSLDHELNAPVANPVQEPKRPSKNIAVKMRVEDQSYEDHFMEETTWLRFVDLQRKGLTFTVEGPKGVDLLARMSEVYDFENVADSYDESDSSSDETDSEADADGSISTDSDTAGPGHDVDAE